MTANVKLTPDELLEAAIVGVRRKIQNIQCENSNRYGMHTDEDTWDQDINGTVGEKVIAKYLGLSWDGSLGDWSADDVGPYQVRHTKHQNGRLILHKEDKDHKPYILVVGKMLAHTIIGWLPAVHGKKNEYWTDPTMRNRPAYFVPQAVLRPIGALQKWMERFGTLTAVPA